MQHNVQNQSALLHHKLAHIAQPHHIDLTLDRMRQALDELNLPRLAAHIITVAGTNGKGSTAATIVSIAQAHGCSTALYTSPHLQRFNERLRLNQQMVSDATLLAGYERIAALSNAQELTWFEFTTLMIFCAIAEESPQLAVLEVGLGGRFDAVNAIDADCAVITSIGLDHQEYLGDSLEKIWEEKIAISRSGNPVILSPCIQADLYEKHAVHDQAVVVSTEGNGQVCIGYDAGGWFYKGIHFVADNLPLPRLSGVHQIYNAATALAALEQFIPLQHTAVSHGLRQVSLAGRLEEITIDQEQIIVDVAHNPQSCEQLCVFLSQRIRAGSPSVALYASLNDKSISTNIALLKPVIQHWVVFYLQHGNRGASLGELQAAMQEAGVCNSRVSYCDDFEQAWQVFKRYDGVKVAYGSFVVIAHVLDKSQYADE